MSDRKRIVAIFSGRVQGVGFRYTIRQITEGYDVAGTVRNLPNGDVELVAEGTETELTDFLTGIENSSLPGFVAERQVEWLEATGNYKGFKIVP